MRMLLPLIACLTVALAVTDCRRAGEPEEILPEEEAPRAVIVADTTLVRDINARLDVDPRLDDPAIDLRASASEGEVTLHGQVPTRRELDIAREVAASTPGVEQVWLDSVRVIADERP